MPYLGGASYDDQSERSDHRGGGGRSTNGGYSEASYYDDDQSTTITAQDDTDASTAFNTSGGNMQGGDADVTLPLDGGTPNGGGQQRYDEDYVYFGGDGDVNLPAQPSPYVDDSTRTVHDMHHALLYLMSNPEEFSEVVATSNEPEPEEDEAALLPYTVFAPDAEVVLPQALTASQLFGIEQTDGIELEAAAGIVPLSQLFLRWLALMPGGDHMNIIDPPGLTVMRIVGGRYRVTAAHRVVWTWMNEFLPDPTSPAASSESSQYNIQFGDLVTMTIVDVFETDLDGKLLSYCPTFDNRSVTKTSAAVEKLRKESGKIFEKVNVVRQSETGRRVEKVATQAASVFYHQLEKAAISVSGVVKDRVGEMKHANEIQRKMSGANGVHATDTVKDALAMSYPNDERHVELEHGSTDGGRSHGPGRSDYYISDDDTAGISQMTDN